MLKILNPSIATFPWSRIIAIAGWQYPLTCSSSCLSATVVDTNLELIYRKTSFIFNLPLHKSQIWFYKENKIQQKTWKKTQTFNFILFLPRTSLIVRSILFQPQNTMRFNTYPRLYAPNTTCQVQHWECLRHIRCLQNSPKVNLLLMRKQLLLFVRYKTGLSWT